MKKLFIIFSFLECHFSLATAQTWDSLGAGITFGNCSYLTSISIYSMVEYSGNLAVGGVFDTAGTTLANCVALWNSSSWDSVRQGVLLNFNGPSCGQGGVYSEAEYQGNLYVGGFIVLPEFSQYGIAQWNGVKWDSVGSGTSQYDIVNALQVYDGKLFAGGEFSTMGGKAINGIAEWNGTNWDSVSNGTSGTINALIVYNGELYAAGSFNSIGHISANNIAKWNDTNWSPAGMGVLGAGVYNTIYSLTEYKGNLYAGGLFDIAGSVPAKNIAVWNGTNWNSVGGGISYNATWPGVRALIQYGSILCAGGGFDSAGNQPVNNIAYWDGTNWYSLGSGVTGTLYPGVLSLSIYSGALIVGGQFTNAGGIQVNNIAEWISPLGIHELNDNNFKVNLFPNPNSGSFTLSISNINEKCNVEIYNVLGEKVLTETLRSAQGDSPIAIGLINLTGQPGGVYFYRVIEEDGSLIGSGKVVIEK